MVGLGWGEWSGLVVGLEWESGGLGPVGGIVGFEGNGGT